ncbi:MAG TPA: hypothetical protein VMW20_07120 [Candidatus Nanoarchaeia archaeon]|nr:hypothetical protein [Candidatus Nanoarchaeia archaeon]
MTSKLTTETGYMNIIVGLIDILEEVNGIEVTEDFIYTNFYRMGERLGKKFDTGKDPQTAMKEFIEYIKPLLDIEIINEYSIENEYKAEIKINNCLIKELCKQQGWNIKHTLCRSSHGFIEGAISSIMGKHLNFNISIADWDVCHGTMELKEKHDIFDFI